MIRPARAFQLQIDFAATSPVAVAPRFTDSALLRLLARRGCRKLEEVRFKKNRGRIISLSKDGRTLHVHACFQDADDEVVSAVVTFLKAGRRSYAYRESIRVMRDYFDAHGQKYAPMSAEEEDHRIKRDIERLPCVGTSDQRAFIREAFARYNSGLFGSKLPMVKLRFSDRMRSRLGHIRYHTTSSGERIVLELALNIHLMLPGNEAVLLDTLLHEMTHMEAWLAHGERAHGADWKAIAKRVGCEATACSTQVIRRRRKGHPVTCVPDRRHLPPHQFVSEITAA
jgi:predicted SprT family Zn-dependent metalloprotease